MKRRDVLKGIAGATAGAVFGSISRSAKALSVVDVPDPPMPVGYVAHGSPLLLADKVRGPELAKWGASIPEPTGIIVMTPHYRAMKLEIGHVGPGFAMYNLPDWILAKTPKVSYATPTNVDLAKRVKDAIGSWFRVESSTDRIGFDHTTWIPLFHMFPKANIPVVEIAMPFNFREAELVTLGRTLAPLRNERILILASGTLTHNLAAADLEGKTSVPAWSADFDAWVKKTLEARDAAPFANWRKLAPAADIAHPDDGGHFRALLFALGAAATKDGTFQSVRFPVEGFELGNLSKRCVELA
jgi:4,5-DOPA dioxygenase extradiol